MTTTRNGANIVALAQKSGAEHNIMGEICFTVTQLEAFAAALASFPQPSDDRAKFEAWVVSYWRGRCFASALTDAEMLKREPDGRYQSSLYEAAWDGWQARATPASTSEPAQVLEDAARYLWLRSMWGLTILEDMLDKMPGRHPGAELDAAIDAARKVSPPADQVAAQDSIGHQKEGGP